MKWRVILVVGCIACHVCAKDPEFQGEEVVREPRLDEDEGLTSDVVVELLRDISIRSLRAIEIGGVIRFKNSIDLENHNILNSSISTPNITSLSSADEVTINYDTDGSGGDKFEVRENGVAAFRIDSSSISVLSSRSLHLNGNDIVSVTNIDAASGSDIAVRNNNGNTIATFTDGVGITLRNNNNTITTSSGDVSLAPAGGSAVSIPGSLEANGSVAFNSPSAGNSGDNLLGVNTSGVVTSTSAISDTQHGNRGGGLLHALVQAGGASGFMSGADKTALDNLSIYIGTSPSDFLQVDGTNSMNAALDVNSNNIENVVNIDAASGNNVSVRNDGNTAIVTFTDGTGITLENSNNTITTASGNLSFNPSGSDVAFNGNNITNVSTASASTVNTDTLGANVSGAVTMSSNLDLDDNNVNNVNVLSGNTSGSLDISVSSDIDMLTSSTNRWRYTQGGAVNASLHGTVAPGDNNSNTGILDSDRGFNMLIGADTTNTGSTPAPRATTASSASAAFNVAVGVDAQAFLDDPNNTDKNSNTYNIAVGPDSQAKSSINTSTGFVDTSFNVALKDAVAESDTSQGFNFASHGATATANFVGGYSRGFNFASGTNASATSNASVGGYNFASSGGSATTSEVQGYNFASSDAKAESLGGSNGFNFASSSTGTSLNNAAQGFHFASTGDGSSTNSIDVNDGDSATGNYLFNVAIGSGTSIAITSTSETAAINFAAGGAGVSDPGNGINFDVGSNSGSELRIANLPTGQDTNFLTIDTNNNIVGISSETASGSGSTRRIKRNIVDINEVHKLLQHVQPKAFYFQGDRDDGYTHYGVIAEELIELLPELVRNDGEGIPDKVRYIEMIPLLLKYIQERAAKLNQYKQAYYKVYEELQEMQNTVDTLVAYTYEGV